jgi:hypothetical protein
MDDSPLDASTASRRKLLRSGLTFALAAPVLAAALQSSPAWARDDDDDDNGNSGPGSGRGGRGRDGRDDDDDDDDDLRLARIGLALSRFSAGLCRVSEATGFNASNPGGDPLAGGRVRVVDRRNNDGDDRVAVALRGAQPDATYEVVFLSATGNALSLGNVGPTNSRGNLAALAPNRLDGARRVGVFVLRRNSNDQFVTCAGD